MAHCYINQGNRQASMDCGKAALKIVVDIHGREHASSAPCLVEIARAYWMEDDFTNAIENATHALSIVEQHHGADTIESVDSLELLGASYMNLEQYGKALGFMQRRLQVLELHHKTSDGSKGERMIGAAIEAIGEVHCLEGNHDQALQTLFRALPMIEATFGPLSKQAAAARGSIAISYTKQGQHAASIPFYQQAVDAIAYTYGPEHALTHRCRDQLDDAQAQLG
jgi:tetratricopeptide (TPR) repeat protein